MNWQNKFTEPKLAKQLKTLLIMNEKMKIVPGTEVDFLIILSFVPETKLKI